MSWPPASPPSMTIGCRLARAVYSAAVRPEGPEPTMSTGAVVRDVAISLGSLLRSTCSHAGDGRPGTNGARRRHR